nr:ATP-binding cassette sub-family A member 9-like isoform X2 [Cherax quadricarinatus]
MDVCDANDLTNIRRITGICPQHDVVFMTLTPREHLRFFAQIRGIPSEKIKAEVEQTLKNIDLYSKGDTKAANLSGGQKRKLSIGIALIGDPKIVFLDEPTAGVDAYSRRRLWTLLKNKKEGKVILLTTHFMDEADILADRKAVVSRGRLRCCGSSLFLKNKFGLGYHLTYVYCRSVLCEIFILFNFTHLCSSFVWSQGRITCKMSQAELLPKCLDNDYLSRNSP